MQISRVFEIPITLAHVNGMMNPSTLAVTTESIKTHEEEDPDKAKVKVSENSGTSD